jgi:hypothetical protein
MSVLIAPETPYGKELWKFEHHQGETHPTDSSIKGVRPTHFQPYPAMMYKAVQKNPWRFEEESAIDEVAQRNFESRGFVAGGQQAAADAYDAGMQDLAVMAAVRAAEDRKLSPAAQAEASAAEQASSKHLGEIKTTPIKKRGRPVKVTA